MIRAMLCALAVTYTFSFAAFAEEQKDSSKTGDKDSQTSIKLEDAAEKKNKVAGDIDQEITNAKMRADSGSKSKRSLSVTGSYTGGAISSAFGEKRPALSSDPSVQKFTSLNLGMNGRYRWTKNDSMTFGTQFGFVTPFQGHVDRNSSPINVNDPTIAYSRVDKISGLQTLGTIAYSYGTSIPSVDVRETHQFGASYAVMKAFQNHLTVGSSASVGYNFFSSKPGDPVGVRTKSYGHDARVQESLGVFPQAEYAFSDKVSARTVFGYFNWKHLYGDNNHYRLLQTYVYQSIGVGFSVARDVYLYPNVQFLPGNFRSDFTNVALSATINVF